MEISYNFIGICVALFICVLAMYHLFKSRNKSNRLAILDVSITVISALFAFFLGIGKEICDLPPSPNTPTPSVIQSEEPTIIPTEGKSNDCPEISTGVGEMYLSVGDTKDVPYTLDSPQAYTYELMWESSNPDCATITTDGTITAKNIGQSLISVYFKDFPNESKKEFRLFVHGGTENNPDSAVSIEYAGIAERAQKDGYYYVYFDINNPFGFQISKTTINLYSEYGNMVCEESVDPSSAYLNFAGLYKLDYYGSFLVVGSVVTEDGKEYTSETHILRPYRELDADTY